ncbi:MAG: Ig-like domain repeat protein, partial [Frankiaceae bacterium]|nr:Ig-like domain repeat protein [Frankiaceae bacterium]
VNAAAQSLSLNGLRGAYTYGDAPSTVSVSGAAGTGAVTYASSDPMVARVDNGVPGADEATVTILGAGTFGITATKAADAHYGAASATSPVIAVSVATPGMTLGAAGGASAADPIVLSTTVGAVGGGATPAGTVTFREGTVVLAADVPLSAAGEAIFSVAKPAAGSHTYTAEYSGQPGRYGAAAAATTRAVGLDDQAPLSITRVPATVTYGDPVFALGTSGGSGSGAISFAVPAGGRVLAVSADGRVTILGAGRTAVTATKAGDASYNPASATVEVVVAPRDISQVAVAVNGGPFGYSGAPWQPTITVSDGSIPITSADYAVSYGANTTVAGGGTATLTGQGNYAGAKTASFSIEPRPVTITAQDQRKEVGAPDPALTWTANPALVPGDTLTGALSYTGSNVGTYPIGQGTLANPNYAITFIPATMTIETSNPTPPAPWQEVVDQVAGLPDPVATIADADLVAAATNAYNKLASDVRAQLPAATVKALEAAQQQAATVNHTDAALAVTASGPDLPWNARLVVAPIGARDSLYLNFLAKLVAKFLGQRGNLVLLALYDIKFIDTLTGDSWNPQAGQSVTVALSKAPVAGQSGITVEHERAADGALETLDAQVAGTTVTFTARSFSLYGLAGGGNDNSSGGNESGGGSGSGGNGTAGGGGSGSGGNGTAGGGADANGGGANAGGDSGGGAGSGGNGTAGNGTAGGGADANGAGRSSAGDNGNATASGTTGTSANGGGSAAGTAGGTTNRKSGPLAFTGLSGATSWAFGGGLLMLLIGAGLLLILSRRRRNRQKA